MDESKNFGIKNWAIEDRPREKLLSKGINSLSNAELIAILIGSGTRNESAVDLSKKILQNSNNDLKELGKLSIAQLQKNKGIGEAKAVTIVAALELGQRRKLSEIINKEKITKSQDVAEYFQSILSDLTHEEFWVLFLNRANKIIERRKISQGGVSGTFIDNKIIFKYAIENLASSIILCHNHPSGNINPSKSDIAITDKAVEIGNLFDISVLDHIIVTEDSYFSFADDGKI
ncbi:MAG: DNA repair protein RadC [Bacteroidetes bacterium]|jgi:DNA repair protein RadC|nr:DNA repair protein RadC [Bacteroidota bacterium]MBT6685890.1 DNA repair protein RadC [Bacteroidota bacterium]MBT7144046.1 DNA repair protein RadC [Bacteroidota bacterium]MBT7490968.1 DNA repair protein RadC [Bacteroidota bacterium]